MIRYVLATPNHLKDLIPLKQALFSFEAVCDPAFAPVGSIDHFRLLRDAMDMVDSEGRAQILAYDGELPIGYLAVRKGPMLGGNPKTATVEGWYVLAEYRNRVLPGLVREARKLAPVRGVDRVQFYVAAGNSMMREIAAGRARPIAEVYELELEHGRRGFCQTGQAVSAEGCSRG